MINFSDQEDSPPYRGQGQSQYNKVQQYPIEDFAARLAEHGLFPVEINPDGGIHKFSTKEGKDDDKAGWYAFFEGDICGAAFGDFRSGFKGTWCSIDWKDLTLDQKQQYEKNMRIAAEKRKKAEQARAAGFDAKAKEAQAMLDAAQPFEVVGHDYPKRKGVYAGGYKVHISQSGHKALLIPKYRLSANGTGIEIRNVEHIWESPDMPKHGLSGAEPEGLFHVIQGRPGKKDVYIGEGFSTCMSIYMATGATVICTFNAGNMPKIAQSVKTMYPGWNIIVAGDNDQFLKPKPDGTPSNPGKDKADETGKILNAQVIFPEFKDLSTEPTDFNDLMVLEGIKAVRDQLAVNWDDQPQGFFEQESMNVFQNLNTETDKDRVICSFQNGDGGVPYGELGVLAGEGATGKTQLLRQMMGSVAFGCDLTDGGLKINEIGRVLMVNGEDDEFSAKKFAKMIGVFLERKGITIPEGNRDNLHFFTRRRGRGLQPPRLVKQGKDGSVEETAAFSALVIKVKVFRPLVLVLDSYSITIGIGENSNEIAGSAIGLIGTLQKYCGTILIIAHTSQAASTEKLGKNKLIDALEYALSEVAIRGVGAIKDNVRWTCLATRVPRKFNPPEFGLKDTSQVIAVAVPKTNLTASQVTPIFFVHDVYKWKNKDGSSNSGMLLKYHNPSEFKAVESDLLKDAEKKQVIKSIREAAAVAPVGKTLFTRGTNNDWEKKYGAISRPQNKDHRDAIVSDLVKAGKLIESKKDKIVFLELDEKNGVENDKKHGSMLSTHVAQSSCPNPVQETKWTGQEACQ